MPLYQRLVRDVLTPLALWRRGDAAQSRYQREFERSQFLSPEEIRRLQLDRLRSLLLHAHEHCPFYRRRFEQARFAPDELRRLEDLRRCRRWKSATSRNTGRTWWRETGRPPT